MRRIDQPKVGQLIKEIRFLTGLTQEQFAAKLGITYSTVNSHSSPSPVAMKLVENLLQDLGEQGQDLLAKYLRPLINEK